MFRLTLEKTLNHLINTNNIDTEGLNNKTVGLSVDEFNLKLLFMFTNSRVFVMEMHEQQKVDVDIKLNKILMWFIFMGVISYIPLIVFNYIMLDTFFIKIKSYLEIKGLIGFISSSCPS
jgi:hypothetical protein